MKRFTLFFGIILLTTILAACSEPVNDVVDVTVNGEKKQLSADVFAIISKKDQLTVKAAILPEEKGTIEIVKDEITYKLFQHDNSAIAYFNDGDIFQYEISKEEFNQVKNAIK